MTYSPADLQAIIDYAEERGIQVIVEIDMPGHTTSIAETYPDLIVARNKQPNWDTYAAQPPSGTLKLNHPPVDKFVKTLLDDLLPRLKEHTTYYHSGGDEVNKNAYELDETVRSNDPLIIQPHINRFVTKAHDVVREHGFSPVVWEEMLLNWNITLGKDTIVQIWQEPSSTKTAVQKGYKTISGSYVSTNSRSPEYNLSNIPSTTGTSTAATANGSTSPPRATKPSSPSTTTVPPRNPGVSSTATTRRPASPRRKPNSSWEAKSRCGPSRRIQ